jgi:hypothetical protein
VAWSLTGLWDAADRWARQTLLPLGWTSDVPCLSHPVPQPPSPPTAGILAIIDITILCPPLIAFADRLGFHNKVNISTHIRCTLPLINVDSVLIELNHNKVEVHNVVWPSKILPSLTSNKMFMNVWHTKLSLWLNCLPLSSPLHHWDWMESYFMGTQTSEISFFLLFSVSLLLLIMFHFPVTFWLLMISLLSSSILISFHIQRETKFAHKLSLVWFLVKRTSQNCYTSCP